MSTQRRNLILLTIDAWRPDFVDEYAGVQLTPNLSALAERTVRFDRAYANAPWTTPALVSVFRGESPARHRVFFEWSSPTPGGPGLAALLREQGFAVPNLCYLNRLENYKNLGYDTATSPDYPHSPADDLLLPALRQHRDRSEPFFLWFHYKFVHLPYWAAAPYRERLGIDEKALPERLRESVCTGFVVPRQQFHLLPEDRDLVQRLYAAGVLQMDEWLSQVLGELQSGDLLDRTTLVITSDHGEELLDHGHVGHASTAHHAILHEEVLRIPLLIIDSRAAAGRRVGARVQGMDLFPTLLSLAGCPLPSPAASSSASAGVDLTPLLFDPATAIPELEGRPFYFHSARMGCPTPRSHAHQFIEAWSDGQKKFIAEHYDQPRAVLYDLGEDPAEQHPIIHGPAVDEAAQRLNRLRDSLSG